MRMIRLVLGVVALGLLPQMLHAQTAGTLFGNVVDNQGAALPGVMVSLEGGSVTTSNGEGQFRFFGVTQGGHTVSASLEGFTTVSWPLKIGPGNSDITITLSPAVSPQITVGSESPTARPTAVKTKAAAPKPAARRPAKKNPVKPKNN